MFKTSTSSYGLLGLLISAGVGNASILPVKHEKKTDETFPLYLDKGPSYNDVLQGNWETSSLLATLASVALGQGGTQQLQKAFKFSGCENKPRSPNLDDAGFYIFNVKDEIKSNYHVDGPMGGHSIDQTTWKAKQDPPSLFNVKRTDVYNAGAFDTNTWWVGGYENAVKAFWKNDTNIVKNVPAAQYLTHLTGRPVGIGEHAPETPIIIDTKATTTKLRKSHHYSVVKTYIDVKTKEAKIKLGDPKGGEYEWHMSEVVGDINGMSRFLNYDKFLDSDPFVAAAS